jgi:hypothetical protein
MVADSTSNVLKKSIMILSAISSPIPMKRLKYLLVSRAVYTTAAQDWSDLDIDTMIPR